MKSTLRSLSPNESKILLSLLEEGRESVFVRDVVHILGGESKARKAIMGLTQKGWFVQLGHGRYVVIPPNRGPENYGENNALAMAAAVIDPSYVRWWNAASFHGLTTQRPTTVTVATIRDAASRTIEGTTVKFVKLPHKKFFGFGVFTVYGRQTQISMLEKTVVDCIDRPRLCGGHSEVARIVYGAKRKADPTGVVDTAIKMGSVSLLQRLGFFADVVDWVLPADLRNELRRRIPPLARSGMGAKEKRDGHIGYVPDWGLSVNLSKKRLLADVPMEVR